MIKNILLISFLSLMTFYYTNAQCGATGGIVISEINYNPDDPGGSSDPEQEFIEITNTSNMPIDVSGWSICDQNCFVIMGGVILNPGDTYLIEKGTVNDFGADELWGSVIALSNGGETLTVQDATMSVVFSVTYDDTNAWDSGTCAGGASSGDSDGGGESLQIVDPCANPNDAANWVACTPTPNMDNALPVTLSRFVVKAEEESSEILLQWTTISEENNDYFAVQHSVDGLNFREMEQIKGAGNSIAIHDYEYIHRNPAKGNNFYRLAQVDYNRTVSYSPVKVVKLAKEELFSLQPTLADDQVVITFDQELSKNTNVEVYNLIGQQVLQALVTDHSANVSLQVADLKSGHYLVRIQDGGQLHTARFIKK